MKFPLFGRRAATLMAAAALPLAATTAAAQAASIPHGSATPAVSVKGGVTPDFTCPDATVCLFPNNDYTGNYSGWGGPATLATSSYNGHWYSFSDVAAANPNPGSVNDNSQSIMWIYDKAHNDPECLTPGRAVLSHSFGYFYIEYGIHTCGAEPFPLP